MKKLYFLLLFFTTIFANAQAPFIITWKVEAGDLNMHTPIYGDNNNYTVDFGDGTILTNQTATVSYTYAEAGTYTIKFSGDFNRLNIIVDGWDEIRSVEQWGDIQWTSMENAFKDSFSLVINATDSPNLSQVTNMSGMFEGCPMINHPFNHWDVSNVTQMARLFKFSAYDQPLDNWNVSNVTNMSEMFNNSNFNQPLNNWDVSSVTDMSGMFWNTTFNQPLDNWDVSNVTNMNELFYNVHYYDHSLNGWDVSSVTSMDGMFSRSGFNMPLDNWDVSNVTSMKGMFDDTIAFNQNIESWDVSNVTNMSYMFANTTVFNQNIESWDISNVTNMSGMFNNSYYNQPLNNWNVSNVTNMYQMFAYSRYNQPLNNWDVSNVVNMDDMFFSTINFDQNLSSWEFNQDVMLFSFVRYARAFSTLNYDALLFRFVQMNLQNKIMNAGGLSYCDSAVRDYLINELGWQISSDYLNSECQVSTLLGKVIFDENSNGCEENDIMLNQSLIRIFNETFNYLVPVNEEGIYTANLPQGSFTVEVHNLPSYFSSNPETSEITFEGFGNTETLNFCLTANETVNDLSVNLLPLEEARPGFETDYQLVVKNMGNQNVPTATITIVFDETLQEFVSADPLPESTTTNTLTFIVTNLYPFESRTVNFTTELFVPPTVNGGEINIFIATVASDTDDLTPVDNTFTLTQEVVNSYDPNDKRVLQGEYIYTDQTDEYLDYIIRFQNTGTASAITVRIEDILHENLDWSTLTPVSASHAYRVKITEGNQVEFIFDNINLPHEAADAEGSNGFIAYKIKPVANIQIGDIMEGNASIFFDYNLPIITNTAETKVITPVTVTSSYTNVSCNGEDDGTAKVIVSGGSGEYTFTWSPSGGNEATATGLVAGNYTVTIDDGIAVPVTKNFTITEPQAITISTQPEDVVLAQGGNIVFSVVASNVEQYQWQVSSNGTDWNDISNGGTSPSYAGVTTDTMSITGIPLSYDGYKCRVLLSNGDNCITYSTEAKTQILTPLTVTPSHTNVSCNGEDDGTATVSVSGGAGEYTFNWSPSGGTGATATGLVAGNYTVTIADGISAPVTMNFTITEPEAIVISTQPENVVLVEGGNTEFSVVASNVEEYQWQVSSNGTDWNDISNGGTVPSYTGVTTNTLNITGMPLSYDGYKYRVLLSNGDNCITYSAEANAEVNITAGIDNFDDLGIKIYPNPSKSLVFIDIPNIAGFTNLKITVLDINGRTLLEEPISDNLKNIDLQNFQSGMYIFTISSDKIRFSKYIIKE